MNTKAALMELYDEVCGYLNSDCLKQDDIAHMLEFKYELIDRISEFDGEECECDRDCQAHKGIELSDADIEFIKAINGCFETIK